jgi:hypothetical protein
MKKFNSDKFKKIKPKVDWRANFMKVLEVLYFEEATWAQSRWADYGITEKDKKLIEKEFEKHMSRPGSKMKFHLNDDGGPKYY